MTVLGFSIGIAEDACCERVLFQLLVATVVFRLCGSQIVVFIPVEKGTRHSDRSEDAASSPRSALEETWLEKQSAGISSFVVGFR